MVTNYKNFLSSMVNCIVDETDEFIFDLFDVDEIISAAMCKELPEISAK